MPQRLSEREIRQLDLMRERLGLYGCGELPLQTLVADLDALIDALERTHPSCRRSLQEQWAVIEGVYAVSLDRGMTELGEEAKRLDRNAFNSNLRVEKPSHRV